MNSRFYKDATGHKTHWMNNSKQFGCQAEVNNRSGVSDLNKVSHVLFNRSNSFPGSFYSNNEESYFVNFDQITSLGEGDLNPFVNSIRDVNDLFSEDNIGFIGSKETDSFFDNTSKFQRSVTMDFSNDSKYFNDDFVQSKNINYINYSRSNSDLIKYFETRDEFDVFTDYSLNRGSSGSSTDDPNCFKFNPSIGKGMNYNIASENIFRSTSPNSNLCNSNGLVVSSQNDKFIRQSESLGSLTSDQLKDIGFINKQTKRRSKRGYAPVKLFVNRVPKHMTNEDILKIFNKYGLVIECNIIRDSNGPKGCAFVRFSNIFEAQNAILCIHGKTVLDKEVGPIQVKYADGEIERLGLSPDVQPCGESVKVFVGSLPKNCTEDQLLLLFKQFGHVDEVHIIRDNNKQSKCSAFVTFPRKFMADNAIMFLDKKYLFENAKRPIEVRLAKSRSKQKQIQNKVNNINNNGGINCINGVNDNNHNNINGNANVVNNAHNNILSNKISGNFSIISGHMNNTCSGCNSVISANNNSRIAFGSRFNTGELLSDVSERSSVQFNASGLNITNINHSLSSHGTNINDLSSTIQNTRVSQTPSGISTNNINACKHVEDELRTIPHCPNLSLLSDNCCDRISKKEDHIKFTPPTLLDFWAKPILNI